MTKRQRNALTLATKMQIIHDKDNGMKISEISLKYNVPKSTVCGLMSRKASLLPIAANIPGTRMETTSRIQTQLWSELDVTVGQWCLRQVNRRVCLSRAIIIAQAKQVHAAICARIKDEPSFQFQPNSKEQRDLQKFLDFRGSLGWFQKFKDRSDLRHIKIRGESANADYEGAAMFALSLKIYVDHEDYDPRQIFNVDESGLMWFKRTNRTFVPTSFSQPDGFKVEKKRVTLLFGGNASGYKLKPLFLNQFQQPRAFLRSNPEDFGVYWAANKKAWMTSAIFKDWFERCFVPEVTAYLEAEGLENKVLLLLDNAPGHPTDIAKDHSNIEVLFLPPNTTSLIQPMDQGVIRSFKANYLKAFMNKIASEDTEDDYLNSVKNFDIKKCVIACADAWLL